MKEKGSISERELRVAFDTLVLTGRRKELGVRLDAIADRAAVERFKDPLVKRASSVPQNIYEMIERDEDPIEVVQSKLNDPKTGKAYRSAYDAAGAIVSGYQEFALDPRNTDGRRFADPYVFVAQEVRTVKAQDGRWNRSWGERIRKKTSLLK